MRSIQEKKAQRAATARVNPDGSFWVRRAQSAPSPQSTLREPEAQCCYASSNKHWARDPQGVVWEMFHTLQQAPTYGQDLRDAIPHQPKAASAGGCC